MGYLLDAVNAGEFRQPAGGGEERAAPEHGQRALRDRGRGNFPEPLSQGASLFVAHHREHAGSRERDSRGRSQFFRTYYTPNNCVLTIAGEFDNAEAKRLVEHYFGSLHPGPPLKRHEASGDHFSDRPPDHRLRPRSPGSALPRLARRRLFREETMPRSTSSRRFSPTARTRGSTSDWSTTSRSPPT